MIYVATDYGCSISHSPPGKPQANAEFERKIGIAINGIRAYLRQAGAPNCFWPFAGHCFAVNANAVPRKKGMDSAYKQITGNEWNLKDGRRTFIFGELVMFRPAPTMEVPRKLDSTLKPGVFLDYYMNWRGEFTGQ